jgi:uncharacterized protein YbbK (DUF523 family)
MSANCRVASMSDRVASMSDRVASMSVRAAGANGWVMSMSGRVVGANDREASMSGRWLPQLARGETMVRGPDYTLTEKIRLGVSACNFGARVRWNRKGWDRLEAIGRERLDYKWTPVCPEINSGLGVPRRPIRLVGGSGRELWDGEARIKSRGGEKLTEQVKRGARISLEILRNAKVQAFVFMEGSPTCGVYRTTLKNQRLGRPPGTFGSLLLREDLFLIPAIDMESPVKWWDWRRRLHAFCWLKGQELEDKQQIYDIWHNFKFLCQEIDDREAREIGSILAGMPKRFEVSFAEEWRKRVLRLLRRPSSIERISAVMQKHFAYYRKHVAGGTSPAEAAGAGESGGAVKGGAGAAGGAGSGETAPGELPRPPHPEMSRHKFVGELLEMEKRAVREDFLFGGTPVIFRETRER